MHDEPDRLVNDHHMIVLEDYRDVYLLRQEAFIRYPSLHPLTATHLVSRRARPTVYQQQPFLYYALNCATAHIQVLGDDAVQAFPGLYGVDVEALEGHAG